ncbi:hypothetical protein FACS18942_02960 [Planctomycetales bacterium]|nr:hypothetical protein FACS18942_02960 [Planctomycetales bacterium]GHT35068.1 hypothetical protein FACS189427_03590 [Planctomycetales bacterium]
MNFFLENIWFWLILAGLAGILGYLTFVSSRSIKTLMWTVITVVFILALGFGLYLFVETDQKSVSRMLRGLSAAIENDDLDTVQKYIEPKAARTRGLARANMAVVSVTKARFKDLKVAVSDAGAVPTARISFTAVIHWKTKQPIDGFSFDQPAVELVKFNAELVKDGSSWLVTDNCEFTPRAVP